ncbi:MAG: glutathione S-transferase N-terminal domain-containing protein [Pseudomonadota bacterium]
MSRHLYELCGEDRERLFSAYSWRVRLTLGYKDLAFESRPTRFLEIPKVLDGIHDRVPVLMDGDRTITESFAICTYLEQAYLETPRIFTHGRETDPSALANAALIDNLIVTGLYPTITRMIIKDISDCQAPDDEHYFRTTREQRLGATLEDIQRGRDKERARFATFLKPYRRRLEDSPFLGGKKLLFADIALCSSFCWAIGTSAYDTMGGDDVLHSWFDRVIQACGQTKALKRMT